MHKTCLRVRVRNPKGSNRDADAWDVMGRIQLLLPFPAGMCAPLHGTFTGYYCSDKILKHKAKVNSCKRTAKNVSGQCTVFSFSIMF